MKTDRETLKAWCYWKKIEIKVSEDDLEFVKAIEDLISQVGTLEARLRNSDKLAVSFSDKAAHYKAQADAFREALEVVSKEYSPDGRHSVNCWMACKVLANHPKD